MIYREMPRTWDPAFRPRFYARWGRESAVISARTRRVEYPEYRQLLSIKAAFGGSEDYYVGGRRISVDDDTFLILNAGQTYASCIDSLDPVHSFSVFFAPRLAEQVFDSLHRAPESLLDDPDREGNGALEFDERLYEHDAAVTPVLRHILAAVEADVTDEVWMDEQLLFLLGRMLRLRHRQLKLEAAIPSRRPAMRRELLRRLRLGADFIHTSYREPIGLAQMATAAHLSAYHFLRVFKSVYGVTPSAYLSRKRTVAALRLLRQSTWTMTAIAEHVGFGSRTTLYRHLRRIPDTDLGDRPRLTAGDPRAASPGPAWRMPSGRKAPGLE